VCCVRVAFESISLFRGSPCQARTLVCPRSGYGSRLSQMVHVCVLAFVSRVESSMTCGACGWVRRSCSRKDGEAVGHGVSSGGERDMACG
jgi:hypothetical protein